MITALVRAFGQLSDPRLARVLRLGVGTALGAYALLVGLAWWALSATTVFDTTWVDSGFDALGIVLAALLPLPFFPALATVFMSPWLEEVVAAAEARHHPHLPPAEPTPLDRALPASLRFLGVSLAVNLAALPVYLLLLLTGIAVPLALALNGYLLGREYADLVALRRLEPGQSALLFRNNLGRFWLAGLAIAFLFSIPILNLAAPVIAAAFMTHVLNGGGDGR